MPYSRGCHNKSSDIACDRVVVYSIISLGPFLASQFLNGPVTLENDGNQIDAVTQENVVHPSTNCHQTVNQVNISLQNISNYKKIGIQITYWVEIALIVFARARVSA